VDRGGVRGHSGANENVANENEIRSNKTRLNRPFNRSETSR
jgi:hypothetical protein